MRKLYTKYIPEGQTIVGVIHQHWLVMFQDFIVWTVFGIAIPLFIYSVSEKLQELVAPSFVLLWVILIGIKIFYELINWFNDVWILTEDGIYDLEWSLLKTNVESINYENIEGIEIDKHRVWDSIFRKGDIILHKYGEESLAIYNAYKPYKAADLIDQYLHPEKEPERDRFDMIMDALGGVVNEYLDKNGLKQKYDNPDEYEEQKNNEIDEYTIDVRN